MFEKEAEEYSNNWKINKNNDLNFAELVELRAVIYKANKDGAEFGYNKGYHDAEEHYMNVIDSQHKLVEESKANEWHYVKDGDLPKDMENVLINAFDYGINTCYVAHRLNGKWRSNCSSEIFVHVIAWKEIVLPKEIEE